MGVLSKEESIILDRFKKSSIIEDIDNKAIETLSGCGFINIGSRYIEGEGLKQTARTTGLGRRVLFRDKVRKTLLGRFIYRLSGLFA